eukprot:2955618-Prymnesium_polylepis.1
MEPPHANLAALRLSTAAPLARLRAARLGRQARRRARVGVRAAHLVAIGTRQVARSAATRGGRRRGRAERRAQLGGQGQRALQHRVEARVCGEDAVVARGERVTQADGKIDLALLQDALRAEQGAAETAEAVRAAQRDGPLLDPVAVSYTHLRAHETLMNL